MYINIYKIGGGNYKGRFVPEWTEKHSPKTRDEALLEALSADEEYAYTVVIEGGVSYIIDLSDDIKSAQAPNEDLSNDPAYDSWAEIRG
jgi:hypothetical protein